MRRPGADPRIRRAIQSLDSSDLFISVISIGEITKGISLLNESRKKHSLQIWLQTLEQAYPSQVIQIDIETSRIWGEITALAQKKGRIIPAAGGLIAATARRHGLHVMTRNIADFKPTGALLLDPWATV
jgi:predicted nucleic acid-binding protein